MNRRIPMAAIAAAALAVSCGKTLPEEAPLAVSPVSVEANEQRTVSNVFLVTDSSGTMYSSETFPKAKALSESLILALPDKDARGVSSQYNVTTIGFGGDDRVESAASPFDRQEALEAVRGLELMGAVDGKGGMTPIGDVLAEIEAKLEGTGGQTAVILFSDGVPDSSEDALAVATRLAEERSDGICFHGVQLGDDPAGAQFLSELAATSSCGSMRNANSISSPSAFEQFAKATVVGAALPAVAAAPSPCGTIRLRGIEFGFDSANIDESGAVVLDMAAELLEECRSVNVNVEGHTDSVGTEAYNQGLSERRAGSVKDYLSGTGVAGDRLATQGLGESSPVAPNDTDDGRARNRRVELIPR